MGDGHEQATRAQKEVGFKREACDSLSQGISFMIRYAATNSRSCSRSVGGCLAVGLRRMVTRKAVVTLFFSA